MKKILVVDDCPNVRRLVGLALEDRFVVEQIPNAHAAYEAMLEDPPAAIVLDVMLPGLMDGLELCDRIRAEASLQDVHVVLMTGHARADGSAFERASGADACFLKPFSPTALREHFESVFGGPQDAAVPATPATHSA